MNTSDINAAAKIIRELGHDSLSNLTRSEKADVVSAVRDAVCNRTRDDYDRESFGESGETSSMCSRLLSGDEIFFANQAREQLIAYWFDEIKGWVSDELNTDGDESGGPAHCKSMDSRKAREINAENSKGYAA